MGSPNPQYQVGIPYDLTSIQTIKRNILAGAQTLTVAQSGSLVLFNTAAGYTVVLPVITANDIGVYFDFLWTITNTSTATKIITGAGTSFIGGAVMSSTMSATPSATLGPKMFAFNGSSNIALIAGGADTTAGGLIGTAVRLIAISSVLWHISGNIAAAGTIVTLASDT